MKEGSTPLGIKVSSADGSGMTYKEEQHDGENGHTDGDETPLMDSRCHVR